MRVVITGATGNVGGSLVERLAVDDDVHEMVGVARRRPDWQVPKVRWVTADVAVDDLGPAFAGADAVVHLAWSFHPIRHTARTWDNNVIGSIRVFQAAADAGVPILVHASSIGAYSPARDDRPVTESWPTHALPTAGYGREKSYLERILDTFQRDHPQIRVVRMRPGFIFKRESATSQRRYFAGPLLAGRLARPGMVPVVPDVPGLRLQALHSRDAAEAYRLALTRPVSGPINVATDPVLDARAVAGLLQARVVSVPSWLPRAGLAVAYGLHLVPASPALYDLALSLPVMDTTRARTELGWQPTVDALGAVAAFLEGLRQGAGGPTPPLAGDRTGLRAHELRTGVGATAGVTDDGR